jgi:hypothetical protein
MKKKSKKTRHKTARSKPPPIVPNQLDSDDLRRSNVFDGFKKVYQQHQPLIQKVQKVTQVFGAVRVFYSVVLWLLDKTT